MSKSMVFYTDWFDAAEQLGSAQDQLDFIKGILNYGLRDIAADSSHTLPARLGYNICKGSVETNNKKRNGGALGGAPEGNTNRSKVEQKQPMVESKQPMVDTIQPTINVNDNVNVNVNDNDNVNGYSGKEVAVAPLAPKSPIKRFVKPTLLELQQYCQEARLHINCDAFLDYYEANGWKVGRDSMKDWRAAARNWARRQVPEKRSNIVDNIHNIGDFSNERTRI